MEVTNLHSFDKSRAEKFKDLYLFNNEITYGDTYRYAAKKGAFLQKKGFKEGDIIALLADNSPQWCIAYMAITSIGAIVLPLDPNLPDNDLAFMCHTVDARGLLVSEGHKKRKLKLKSYDVELDRDIDDEKKFRPFENKPEDIASLVFTSGTTGKPKIVTLTHKNLYHTAIATADFQKLNTKDTLLCILPLFHVYALDANFIGPFANGSSLIYQPSLKGPDIMKSLADHPITIFPAAPQLWELFMDSIIRKVKNESAAKYKLFMFFLNNGHALRKIGLGFLVNKIFAPVHDIFGRSHRFFISGGAPLKRKYAIYYRNVGFTLTEGYGLTETTGPITLPDYANNVLFSVGIPTPGNYVKIKNVGDDGIGEVWLKGDSVMPGYYKNEEANREAFDAEGYFKTGDLGYLDRKGNIFLRGRSKNVIVLPSGKNVYPEELESYYKQSELISEIAVFGLSRGDTESVFAVIVPTKKEKESYAQIKEEMKRLNQGLPGYKTVQSFAISMDPLPTNTTRKVLYSKVIDSLTAGFYQAHEDDDAVPQDILEGATPKEEMIVSALKERFGLETLYASQTLSDFGVDSLGLVDLIVYLEEKINVQIDTKAFSQLQTLQEVFTYLEGAEEQTGESIEEKIFKGKIEKKPNKFFNPLHHPVLFLFKIISKLFWQVKVINPEKLDLNNTIVIANHQSFLEMFWIAWAVPLCKRNQLYVTGKKKMSFVRFIFPILPVIWIDENNALDVLKQSADILRQNKSLLVYPEGTRTPDGEIHEFKTGAAYLSKNLKKKVVPITVHGAYEIWPRGQRFPKFFTKHRGSLTIGDTIDPEEYGSMEELNDALRKAVLKYW